MLAAGQGFGRFPPRDETDRGCLRTRNLMQIWVEVTRVVTDLIDLKDEDTGGRHSVIRRGRETRLTIMALNSTAKVQHKDGNGV